MHSTKCIAWVTFFKVLWGKVSIRCVLNNKPSSQVVGKKLIALLLISKNAKLPKSEGVNFLPRFHNLRLF